MSSKKNKNDATSIFINQLVPTRSGRYISNIVYADTQEGLRTDVQALNIRRLYEEYSCDYIVLDTNGLGLGVYDSLAKNIVDTETGEVYPALSCCNNKEMASRCTDPDAEKVIWSIKANAHFNSTCAFLLREGFRNGRIHLLANEYDSEEYLKSLKGYSSLNPQERMMFQLPYIQTRLLVEELVNLQHDESEGRVKIYEKSGARKDRYSSLSYNYYVATQIENKYQKRNSIERSVSETFVIKPPKSKYISGRRFANNECDRRQSNTRWN